MSYQVLARQFRPQNFQQLVGQEHVSQALINGLQQQRLHHAFLFTGTRGVGKTTVARILAKALNCEQGVSGEPCCQCETCNEISEGRFIDLVEVDAASRTGVDDTRDLLENVQYAPSKGRYKIYLIDEVHMFSNSSFNALLKTLEEPPPHVKFLLATTEPKKLPITVLSRCLQFNLKRLTLQQIADHLLHLLKIQDIEHEAPAVELLARAADGSMRDGLSLLDQSLAFGGGKILTSEVKMMLGTIEQNQIESIMNSVINQDGDQMYQAMNDIFQMAPDYVRLLDDLALLMHEVSMYQVLQKHQDVSQFPRGFVNDLAANLSEEQVQLYYQILIKGKAEIGLAPDRKTGFEMTLLRLFAFEIGSPVQHDSHASGHQPSGSKHTPVQPANKSASSSNAVKASAPQSGPVTNRNLEQNIHSQASKASDSIVKIPPAQLSESIWPDLFEKMQLKGTARELARNAHVSSMEEGVLTLSIDAQAHVFMTELAQSKLTDALQNHIQGQVAIKFIKAEDALPSIARKQQERQMESQQNAQSQVQQSPFVQDMQREFQAEVIEVIKKV